MQNPILNRLNQAPQVPNNNPMGMLQQFQQFRQQVAGQNPQQMVQNLINSGQMSQQQFNTLSQQAQSVMNMLKR